ncbi:DUF2264 domain-containing protein [Cerasicoccus fimbriatus]|uniref:DUF2264 domain-containing protein n=1 Tax=Cerasicoccus fimbriatus TaxID=3014554 RepID=UPI0022B321D1|nr:DUF2264 domain-containing protein [Cerasicoccus sp. TK19100]
MTTPLSPRQIWVDQLTQIAKPLLENLAAGRLRERMPIEEHLDGIRAEYAHLEAFGRALAGIAPWLENTHCPPEEAVLRDYFIAQTLTAMEHATDPKSPDAMNFTGGHQPLVDAAFLAQGLLRSWNSVWQKLSSKIQARVVNCLQSTRVIQPAPCNWLLFSAIIEAFLYKAGAQWDAMRIDYAIRQHMQWYKGDGVYGDGADFHWDYYNSFVIHPMLYDIVNTGGEVSQRWKQFREPIEARLVRYAVVQERFIAPDGTYPPIGRSLAYRIGAFQALSQAALIGKLPAELSPASVRCALTAVLQRQFGAANTFDEQGWLRIGFCGAQPSLGEKYICTGSLYLCLCGFLHLGLRADAPFWIGEDEPWTSKRAWSGEDLPCDHAMHG